MKRTPLMRLTNQGIAAVDATFLGGAPECLREDPTFVMSLLEQAPVPHESLCVDVPGVGPLGPEDDPRVAALLHQRLPIRRAVATDTRFWAWLVACHLAPLVRRRWSVGDRPPNRKRFVGGLSEHGLARLWWAAELTTDHGRVDVSSLAALLASQYRTDRLLSMPILRHSPVLRGFLDAIRDDIRWQVLNAVCQRVGVLATTYAVSAMTREETARFVADVYASVVATGSFSDSVELGGDEPGGE